MGEVLRLLRVEVRWVTYSRHDGAAKGCSLLSPGLTAVSSSKQDWLPWSLLLLSLTCDTGAFYVPGVAPINFHQNDPVEIKVSAFRVCRSLCAGPEDLASGAQRAVLFLLWLQRSQTSQPESKTVPGSELEVVRPHPHPPGPRSSRISCSPSPSGSLCMSACMSAFSLCVPLSLCF